MVKESQQMRVDIHLTAMIMQWESHGKACPNLLKQNLQKAYLILMEYHETKVEHKNLGVDLHITPKDVYLQVTAPISTCVR